MSRRGADQMQAAAQSDADEEEEDDADEGEGGSIEDDSEDLMDGVEVWAAAAAAVAVAAATQIVLLLLSAAQRGRHPEWQQRPRWTGSREPHRRHGARRQ